VTLHPPGIRQEAKGEILHNKMKLTEVDFLKLFNSADYGNLLQDFNLQRFPKKTLIYSPFEERNLVFIVKSGRLRVYLSYEDKEFTLSILDAGDIFSTHTQAFVQALDGAEILVCETTRFQKQLFALPGVSIIMVKVLGDLLKNSISTIEGLAFKDVRRRLVEYLIEAESDRGRHTPAGSVVELGVSTEDIALLVGTTRQTISQILNDFIKHDILEKVNRRTLLIKNLAALRDWENLL
jgi:CRP/FNR family transcriptional regulator, carbon monoxide oxidation system transcription regulator